MRLQFKPSFPSVLVHTGWRTLQAHPLYNAAKTTGDVEAAIDLIEAIADDSVLDAIVEHINKENTFVLAPSLTPETNKNALGLGYAMWLGKQLDLEVCKTVFQLFRPKKDRLGLWERMRFPSHFEGEIEAGSDFVLVDDVCTFGGTLADLYSFTNRKGCEVIVTTCLASSNGNNPSLAITEATLTGLRVAYSGNELDALLKEEFGYDCECLTEREGSEILRTRLGIDAVRERILKTRHA